MQHANSIPQRRQEPTSGLTLCLPTTTGYAFVSMADISYFEAAANYSWLYTSKNSGRVLIVQSLCQLEGTFNDSPFCRIHRSFMVNLSHITQMEYDKTRLHLFTGVTLPLGRSYQQHFFQKITRGR